MEDTLNFGSHTSLKFQINVDRLLSLNGVSKNVPLCYNIKLNRTKIQEGDKNVKEVLDSYEEVNTQTLKYVTYSIHDSDISDFYR